MKYFASLLLFCAGWWVAAHPTLTPEAASGAAAPAIDPTAQRAPTPGAIPTAVSVPITPGQLYKEALDVFGQGQFQHALLKLDAGLPHAKSFDDLRNLHYLRYQTLNKLGRHGAARKDLLRACRFQHRRACSQLDLRR